MSELEAETVVVRIEDQGLAATESIVGVGHAEQASLYKPELDVLRFFAFVAVFVVHTIQHWSVDIAAYHVPFWALWPIKVGLGLVNAGVYGVDLFFVLSGYLITDLLLHEKAKMGSLNVRAFYIRRILRIWPLYYFFVALAALVPFLSPHHQFGIRYVLPFLCMIGNWSFVFFGWPGSAAVPLWSVSVEEQFYLLWPPIVARLSRRQIVITAAILIVVANITRLVAVELHQSTQHLWGNTFAHLDSIAAGILLAVYLGGDVIHYEYKSRIALIAVGMLCLAARGHFVVLLPNEQLSLIGTSIGYPVVVLACTAILVAFIGLPFRLPAFEYLGKISYGLYVYHMMSIFIINRLIPDSGILTDSIKFLGALGITIAISAISYAFMEKPILNLKRKFTYVESRPV